MKPEIGTKVSTIKTPKMAVQPTKVVKKVLAAITKTGREQLMMK